VCAEVVLDCLVVCTTDSGFFNSHFGELYFIGNTCNVHCSTNLVNLLLGETLHDFGSFLCLSYQLIYLLYYICHDIPPLI
jgi:hypothetical protein